MGGDSPPLEKSECHCWKMERWFEGRTGLPYSSIAMMEKLDELEASIRLVAVATA